MTALLDRLAPRPLGSAFRWLWASNLAANLGDGILLAAGPLLVTTLTREPLAVAAATFVQWLPGVIVGIPAGAIVDRVDRRRLTIVVNLVRAGVLGILAVTIATEVVSLPILYVSLFVLASAESFSDNAHSALLATTVPKEHLGIANSRLTGARIVANNLAGPPIGAFLIGIGLMVPFATAAICVVAAAVLIARMAPPRREAREEHHIAREIADGMRWLWNHRPVRALALTIFFFNVTYGAAFSVYVLLAKERLGLTNVGFGFLLTAAAIGGLIASAAYPALERRFSLANLMRGGLAIETVTHLVLATTTLPIVAGIMMTIFGAHTIVWGTLSTTIRQRAVPSSLLGRVTSVYALSLLGGLVIGAPIGGLLAQRFGITAPFWFGFVGSAILLVLIWRTLDDIAHAPVAEEAQP
ncbi:MAG TPA: MFS transporter [Candidatus Limnocylindrales bacterium]|nr:MFS transporter [Candidatus Limnocylindrales bacterium]